VTSIGRYKCTLRVVEGQGRNYTPAIGTVITVRCARCDERRPGTTATAFLELEFSVPPWADESWRSPGGYYEPLDERSPHWWPKRIQHRSALSAYRAGQSAGKTQWNGHRQRGSLAAISRSRLHTTLDPTDFLALAGVRDPLTVELHLGKAAAVPSREDAIRHRAEPKDAADQFSQEFNPRRGLELGPCRGSGCKHRPRVKLRSLYAQADAAARAGGQSIYV
jgi:hypothetical protein